MGVIHDGGYRTDIGANEKLTAILTELEKFTKNIVCTTEQVVSTTSNNLTFYRKGCLFWWKKISNAATYRLILFIEGDEVDIIEFDRNKSWYCFAGYVNGLAYTAKLIAEDRSGQSIATCTLRF